jgi:hypothetical protein
MRTFLSLFALLALAWPSFLTAQEVRYIDITNVSPRTELRYPPSPPPECKDEACIGSGSGGSGVSVGDGAPDQRDPHALGVYLLDVTPAEIRSREPFEAEFKILNTGSVPIEVPITPHLSDLQPSNESVAFSCLSLVLSVRGEGGPEGQGEDVRASGSFALYGSHEHEGSILELKPGEWIRIRATMKLSNWPNEPVFARLRGSFWLRRNTFHPQPGGAFTEIQNLYPNATPTPSIPVHLLGQTPRGNPKL